VLSFAEKIVKDLETTLNNIISYFGAAYIFFALGLIFGSVSTAIWIITRRKPGNQKMLHYSIKSDKHLALVKALLLLSLAMFTIYVVLILKII